MRLESRPFPSSQNSPSRAKWDTYSNLRKMGSLQLEVASTTKAQRALDGFLCNVRIVYASVLEAGMLGGSARNQEKAYDGSRMG